MIMIMIMIMIMMIMMMIMMMMMMMIIIIIIIIKINYSYISNSNNMAWLRDHQEFCWPLSQLRFYHEFYSMPLRTSPDNTFRIIVSLSIKIVFCISAITCFHK